MLEESEEIQALPDHADKQFKIGGFKMKSLRSIQTKLGMEKKRYYRAINAGDIDRRRRFNMGFIKALEWSLEVPSENQMPYWVKE